MTGSRSSAGAWRWLPVLPILWGVGCGGPQSLGDAGAKCFRDDDCAPGLICVAPPTDRKSRVCSDDPTPLISNVEGPPVAMGGDAAMAGSAGTATAGGGAAGASAGGMAGMPTAGGGAGGSAAGTETGGTDSGGTSAGGTESGGTESGGTAGSNAGTDPGGTGGSVAGTASDGGAP